MNKNKLKNPIVKNSQLEITIQISEKMCLSHQILIFHKI